MDDKDRTDKDLASDIGYALSRSRLRPKGHVTIDICREVGAEIVKHLRLANWRIKREPPRKPHTSPDPHLRSDED